jgi:hypothetical protein
LSESTPVSQRTPEDAGDDALPARAERDADADLTRAPRHDERQHRVDPGERSPLELCIDASPAECLLHNGS